MEEFDRKKREWEEAAGAKTAKNRAKRQKKKERAKGKAEKGAASGSGASADTVDVPLKKRRLVNGAEVVFRKPGEESSDEDEEGPGPVAPQVSEDGNIAVEATTDFSSVPIVDAPRITIHEDD